MPLPIQLGSSHFPSIRAEGRLYVDKTGLVCEVLDAPAQVSLYPRPRRFGKTISMSMLQAFFEIGPDRAALFADLQAWSDPETRKHFQRYPVIALSLKDTKSPTWAECKSALDVVLAREVERHAAEIGGPDIPHGLRERLEDVIHRRGDTRNALRDLAEALALHHGERVVILIDEYDAAVLSSWEHGYYDECIQYMRRFMSAALKDNPVLFRAVLTGVLRVARESMFSDLNNLEVYSPFQRDRPECYGFTEAEVAGLLSDFGRTSLADEVRRWYNGYRFGDSTVYNPFSVMSMLAKPKEELQGWWLNTSENTLARELLLDHVDLHEQIATLLAGGSIETLVEDGVPLRELSGKNVWGLLLYAGYFSVVRTWHERTEHWAELTLPNLEVRGLWESTFNRWLADRTRGVGNLPDAVLAGDAPRIEAILGQMLLRHVSPEDVGATKDEAFYHAFVLGLLVVLEGTHAVRSNRGTGYGRADVQILPKRPGLPGVVIEFKRRPRKPGERLKPIVAGELEALADQALAQIDDNKYTTELAACGASPVHKLGIAFAGQDVVVRG